MPFLSALWDHHPYRQTTATSHSLSKNNRTVCGNCLTLQCRCAKSSQSTNICRYPCSLLPIQTCLMQEKTDHFLCVLFLLIPTPHAPGIILPPQEAPLFCALNSTLLGGRDAAYLKELSAEQWMERSRHTEKKKELP